MNKMHEANGKKEMSCCDGSKNKRCLEELSALESPFFPVSFAFHQLKRRSE